MPHRYDNMAQLDIADRYEAWVERMQAEFERAPDPEDHQQHHCEMSAAEEGICPRCGAMVNGIEPCLREQYDAVHSEEP